MTFEACKKMVRGDANLRGILRKMKKFDAAKRRAKIKKRRAKNEL
jgi:hypothetical protein